MHRLGVRVSNMGIHILGYIQTISGGGYNCQIKNKIVEKVWRSLSRVVVVVSVSTVVGGGDQEWGYNVLTSCLSPTPFSQT